MSALSSNPEPRRNADLLGHDTAERVLLAAYNSGRLPHSWLIAGIPGIGKATLAYRFARFVLSENGRLNDGAGLFGAAAPVSSLHVDPAHPVFGRIAAAGHADLLTIERQVDEKRERLKGEIAVADVRRIPPFLRLTAAEGGWRVVIVDGADRMNASGQNAILKILEEPPPRALLLLVVENPGNVLPTIRSRTRKLSLRPLSDDVVDRLLARYSPDLPDADRQGLALLAEGSIGRALDLADAGGLQFYRELIGFLETLPNLDAVALHALGDRFARKDGDAVYRTMTELLVWWLARLARGMARGQRPPEIIAGEGALMTRLGAHGLDRWMEVWEKVSRLFARADSANLDRKQVVLNAFMMVETAARD